MHVVETLISSSRSPPVPTMSIDGLPSNRRAGRIASLQKRASKISEFLPGFSLLFQGHEKVSLLFFGNARIGELPRCFARLINPEIDPVSQLFDEFFQGRVSSFAPVRRALFATIFQDRFRVAMRRCRLLCSDLKTHTHGLKDLVAHLQILRRIEIARPG